MFFDPKCPNLSISGPLCNGQKAVEQNLPDVIGDRIELQVGRKNGGYGTRTPLESMQKDGL